MNAAETKAAFRHDAADPPSGNRRNHVLAIAIDAYQHHRPLRNPVKDCEAILDQLQRCYDFDLEEDNFKFLKTSTATKREIYKAFEQYQPSKDSIRKGLTGQDNLLVIFTGHGHIESGQGMGFWVPFIPKEAEEPLVVDFISNSDLLSWLNACGAYQITIIADACFSGSLLTADAGLGHRRIKNLPAPYILASGRVQEVSDGYNMSPFAQRLIAALKKHEKGALYLDDLGREVLTGFEWKTHQTPWHKQLDTCGVPDVGDHHFRLRKGAEHRSDSDASPAPAKPDLLARLLAGSQAYHRQLRNGRFKALQISDLLLTGNSLGFAETQVKLGADDAETPGKFLPTLQSLWQSPQAKSPHTIVMGDGGMGKTVTLVRLWEQLAVMNLERLDLRMLYLNGIPLSHHLGGYRYLPARLDKALLDGKKLFPQGHSNWVSSAIYSPDGKKVLSASHDKTVKEWSVETGACLQTLEGHSEWVSSAIYSSDGKKVLSASHDKTVKEWSVETGACLQTLEGHSNPVRSAIYSPDGKKVLSASGDKTVKEWSVETGACLQTLEGHSSGVNSAIYSPDGKKVLSASRDKTVKEWSVETGACLQTLEGHSHWVSSAIYSPDGKKVLSASGDKTVKEWSVETGACLQTLEGHSSGVNSAIYSPDGKKVLSASRDKTVKEWSVETGACLQTLEGHSHWVGSAIYSPDGKKVLSASGDGTVKEWSVETGACLQTLEGHSSGVSSAIYSPDGKKVLSASDDNTVKEWSVETGACLQTLEGHSDPVSSAIYSPDGKKVLSASLDNTVKEWSVATGACLRTMDEEEGQAAMAKAMGKEQPGSSDGCFLETGGNEVLEKTAAGQVLRTYENLPGLWVWHCAFTRLHESSIFTEEEKRLLRMYGGEV